MDYESQTQLLSNTEDIKVKVSSFLNKQVKFGAKNMFDGDPNSCWNSDQGSPQYIVIAFNNQTIPKQLKFIFQGGFVGQDGIVEIGDCLEELVKINLLEDIKDCNSLQIFDINNENQRCRYLKITFPFSTDFYGRITIYSLEIFGIKF